MMGAHTRTPSKKLTDVTQDVFTKFRYNLGSAMAKIPVKMDDTRNASFMTDTYTDWNARHGTTSKALLTLLDNTDIVLAMMI